MPFFALQMSANDPKRTFDGDAVFSVLKPWRAAGAELIVDRKVEVVMPEKLDELRAGGQRSYSRCHRWVRMFASRPRVDIAQTQRPSFMRRGRLMPPPTNSRSLAALVTSLRADPPDHTGARNLNKRTVAGAYELRRWIGLAEVAHRAVVGDPGAAVRPEPHVGRTIERVGARLQRPARSPC